MTSKSKLNLYCQKSRLPTPCYTTERVTDQFISTVTVDKESYKSQTGQRTKKTAEDDAASVAVEAIIQRHPNCSSIDEIIAGLDSQSKKRSKQSSQTQHLYLPFGFQPPVQANTNPVQVPTLQSNASVNAPVLQSRGIGPSSTVNPNVAMGQHHGTGEDSVRNKGTPQGATQQSPVTVQPSESGTESKSAGASDHNSGFLEKSSGLPAHKTKYDFQKTLEEYCRSHGLPDPGYHMRQTGRLNFTASVTVGGQEFSTERQYTSFEEAKESTTLLALAALGIGALALSKPGSQQPSAASSTPQTHTDNPADAIAVARCSGSPAQNLQPPSFFQSTARAESETTQPQLQGSTAEVNTIPTHTQQPQLVSRFQALAPNPPRPTETQPAAQSLASMQLPPANYKQILQEYCAKHRVSLPKYSVEYPEDSVGYIACVTVNGQRFSSPPLSNKKAAEMLAAGEAVKALGIPISGIQGKGSSPQLPHQSTPSLGQTQGITSADATSFISHKNLLQEHAQKTRAALPHYETEATPDGFRSTVIVQQQSGEALRFTGSHHSVKRAAEQEAAKIACSELGLLPK